MWSHSHLPPSIFHCDSSWRWKIPSRKATSEAALSLVLLLGSNLTTLRPDDKYDASRGQSISDQQCLTITSPFSLQFNFGPSHHYAIKGKASKHSPEGYRLESSWHCSLANKSSTGFIHTNKTKLQRVRSSVLSHSHQSSQLMQGSTKLLRK